MNHSTKHRLSGIHSVGPGALIFGLMLSLMPTPLAQADEGRSLTVTIENDALVDTDRYYTNGIRLEYAHERLETSTLARRLAGLLLGVGPQDDVLESFAVGHTIFTPEDIETADPLPSQRPYAGYLFFDYTINRQNEDGIHWLLFQVGLVGPSAGGEEIQNWYHREIIDRPEALGWDNQLSDEVGFVIAYDRQFAPWSLYGDERFGTDVTVHSGVALGTIHTDVRAGATLRVGSGLTLDYGPPRIKPALSGSGFFNTGHGWSTYAFLGVEARAVAHDIFLDGSLLRSGEPGVEKEGLVGDIQTGLVVQRGAVQAAFTFVHRTKEFDQQSEAQQFAAFSLSKRF